MEADRIARGWTWTVAGAAVGYIIPLLVMWLTALWSMHCDGDFQVTDAPLMLVILLAIYTIFGAWVGYVALGAGCGLTCAWLPRRFGRWGTLTALTAMVLLASLVVSSLGWLPPLWPS